MCHKRDSFLRRKWVFTLRKRKQSLWMVLISFRTETFRQDQEITILLHRDFWADCKKHRGFQSCIFFKTLKESSPGKAQPWEPNVHHITWAQDRMKESGIFSETFHFLSLLSETGLLTWLKQSCKHNQPACQLATKLRGPSGTASVSCSFSFLGPVSCLFR